MRKTLLFTAIILFAGMTAANPQTEIQVQELNPAMPEPGDTVKMNVLVANNGNSDSTYRPVELETPAAIESLGTTSNFDSEFSLCGGCQTTGTFYLKVNDNASTGTYPIDISVENLDDIGTVEKTVLEVDGNANLILSGEGSVKQGDNSSITVKIENIGEDTASQVTASLEHPMISFQPSKLSFGDIPPGETREKTVEIEADENMESGPETISTKLSYLEDGEKREDPSSLSTTVLKDVRLAISEVDTGATVSSNSRIMVELENIGNSEAKQIRSELICEGASEEKSTNFVGSLDADESVPTVYRVTPEQESVDCDLAVSYTGAREQSFEESISFTADRDRSYLPIIAVLAAALAAGAIYWRRREEE